MSDPQDPAATSKLTPKLFTVHVYQCRNDGSVMVTPFKAQYGDPYLCRLCSRYMRWLYAEKTERQLKMPIYNPKPGDF